MHHKAGGWVGGVELTRGRKRVYCARTSRSRVGVEQSKEERGGSNFF